MVTSSHPTSRQKRKKKPNSTAINKHNMEIYSDYHNRLFRIEMPRISTHIQMRQYQNIEQYLRAHNICYAFRHHPTTPGIIVLYGIMPGDVRFWKNMRTQASRLHLVAEHMRYDPLGMPPEPIWFQMALSQREGIYAQSMISLIYEDSEGKLLL